MPRKKKYEYTIEEMVEIARENPDCKWPFFQFYPNRFEGDNAVKMMGVSGVGAYMFLLCSAWQEEDCGLPCDDESLAILSHANSEWSSIRDKVMRCFKLVNDRYYNPLLLYCRVDSIGVSKSRRAARAQRGGTNVPTNEEQLMVHARGLGLGKGRGLVVKAEDASHVECSKHLMSRIVEHRQIKVTDELVCSWTNDVRLMVERDGRTVEDIVKLIDECHDMEPTQSGFTWRTNILSMGTLRKKWNEGKIAIGMTTAKPAQRQYGRQSLSLADVMPGIQMDKERLQ